MKFWYFPYGRLVLLLIFFNPPIVHADQHPVSVVPSGQIRFVENKNQWDTKILFNASIPGGKVFLEKNALTYYIFSSEDLKKTHPLRDDSVVLHGHVWKEIFLGANQDPQTTPASTSTTYYNYFIGNDPSRWAANVHDYAQVSYADLYPGVDMNVYGFGPNLKYDLIVEPSADPSQIQIQYEGAKDLSIENGNLIIKTSIGDFTEQKPFAYQIINGNKSEVPCKFVLRGTIITFSVDKNYDQSLPLIIDPTLIFSTYTGSFADNFGYTATYDATGAMYLGGLVNGTGYPVTTGAVQLIYAGGTGPFPPGNGNDYACDYGIMKLSSMGNAVLWATYLGGTDNETPHSMVVDNNGDLIIYGRTWSDDFPITANAFDNTYNNNGDIVVSKISEDGTTLMGSTFLGGSGEDGVNYDATEPGYGNLKVNYGDDARGEVIIDVSNNIYVATCTKSANFPVTTNAYQTTIAGSQDGCIFKMNSDCSGLIWSTYLGGSNDDACYSLDLFNGEVYATGGTMSSNFPATSSVLHSTFQGGTMDGFLVHLSADGTSLMQSTFIGTTENDQSYFVKLDKNSNAYLYGQTNGSYPVTSGVYSNSNSGQFIHKLLPDLSATVYSTVFGNGNGESNISPTAFAVDTCENIYISGWGGSIFSQWSWFSHNMNNMPITPDALQTTTDGTDFYIAVFEKDMTALQYSTYFGGNTGADDAPEHVDGGTSRFDKNGIIYQAICGGCGGNVSSVPTTPGAWSETNNSTNCNEVGVKIEINLFIVTANASAYPTTTGCVPLTVGFTNTSVNATQYYWNFGDGGNSTEFAPTYTFNDTGTFNVMLIATDPTACVPVDTAYTSVVVYNNLVTAAYTTTITDFCDSLQVDFSATSTGTATSYTWDFGDSTAGNGLNVSHTYYVPGVYTVMLIVNDPLSCNQLDTIIQFVDYTQVLIAEVSNSAYFGCAPFTVDFSNIGYGGLSFFWIFGDGETSTDSTPSHTFSLPGIYNGMLVIADDSACNKADTAFFSVTVLPYPPDAAFTANPTVIQDYISDVQFTNQSSGALSYLWNFGDGDTSTETNPLHTYLLSGEYLACLTANNAGGCPDESCIFIKVQLIPVVDVPNAFSPNGDGQNDLLFVKGQDIKNLNFKVFNRWGELVFETNDLNHGWNGFYQGVKQEMEVYTWTLGATFTDGKAAVRSGNVTLLR